MKEIKHLKDLIYKRSLLSIWLCSCYTSGYLIVNCHIGLLFRNIFKISYSIWIFITISMYQNWENVHSHSGERGSNIVTFIRIGKISWRIYGKINLLYIISLSVIGYQIFPHHRMYKRSLNQLIKFHINHIVEVWIVFETVPTNFNKGSHICLLGNNMNLGLGHKNIIYN